jgi:hypothetical protein
LAISPEHVAVLAKEGTLPKAGHGQYKLEGIRNYTMKQRALAANTGEREAKQKLTETNAAIAEMKRQLLFGELIRYDEALSAFTAVISIIRTRMLALPSRCSPRIIGQASGVVEAAEIIREEVNAILDYLVQAKQAAIDSLKPCGRALADGNPQAGSQASHTD